MNYEELIEAHKKYGTEDDDIIKRNGYQEILENVVLAPWWSNTIFEKHVDKIVKVGEKVYNIYGDDFQFSFIQIQNIGASSILEAVLPLALTKCKRIVFIGSAGALNSTYKVGDLVVPIYSYSGVGACRFLNSDLKDDFEKKTYPDKEFSDEIIKVIKKSFNDIPFHEAVNYSVDSIFAQFPHIQHFLNLGCDTIEMETSALFECGQLCNIKTSAIFCISDNTIENKSLFSGRTKKRKGIATSY